MSKQPDLWEIVLDFICSLFKFSQSSPSLSDVQSRHKPQNRQTDDRSPSSVAIASATLIVAISADHPLVSSLKSNSSLREGDGDALYEACSYLGLSPHQIDWDGLREKYSSQGRGSEYDVYLLKFELKREDERFGRSINPMDRLDAFCELAQQRTHFALSKRLSISVFEELNCYNR